MFYTFRELLKVMIESQNQISDLPGKTQTEETEDMLYLGIKY